MSRTALRADAAMALALAGRPDTLSAIEEHFRTSAGRLGYFLARPWFDSHAPHAPIDHVSLDEDRTLRCKLEVEDAPFDWTSGELSLWRSRIALPQTAVASLPGRRLSELVDHPLLPREATIVEVVDATGPWLRLRCEGWSVGIDEARRTIAGEAA